MSVKHKLLHWYGTLLSENPSFSYKSPLVNQKPVWYFKSKYPVNMTDEGWLQFFRKQEDQWATYRAPEYNVPPFLGIDQGGHFCLLIGPQNTNLVEDVEILLPVKFR